jgi:apoptosis inhibitory protein 5 (API5)
LQVRVQAIRGLPLFCKDTPEYVSKIVDILAQLLMAGIICICYHILVSITIYSLFLILDLIFVDENVERDAVQKALMSLLRQDVKGMLYCNAQKCYNYQILY